MFNFLANFLVVVGICLLMIALIPICQLIGQLPSGPLRRRWYVMVILIAGFIVGYISFIYVFWSRHTDWVTLIVPAIFFFGAGFVRLTAALSFQTAEDIRRLVLLEQESITDPVTGMYNRRYLDRRLEEEVARGRRSGIPLSILLLDIDHFKRINDTYGHQVGDQVLNNLGKLIRTVIRGFDVAARYGGEELLVIAPNTTTSSAVALAERLREQVEIHALGSEPYRMQEIRITVSIGVASLDSEIADYQHLVANADQALYRAKQEGRNRVSTYSIGAQGIVDYLTFNKINPCSLAKSS
jgi:diguanylate cyclase (GGDEF)-like protein